MMFASFAIMLLLAFWLKYASAGRIRLLIESASLELLDLAEQLDEALRRGEIENREVGVALASRIRIDADPRHLDFFHMGTLVVAMMFGKLKPGEERRPDLPSELQLIEHKRVMILAFFLVARHPVASAALSLLEPFFVKRPATELSRSTTLAATWIEGCPALPA